MPRVQHALRAARTAVAAQPHAALLLVAEQRICQLLGAPEPDQPPSDQVASSNLGLAVVALVEQWVIDVANITDDMVAAVLAPAHRRSLITDRTGVLVVEQRVRLDLAWSRLGLSA